MPATFSVDTFSLPYYTCDRCGRFYFSTRLEQFCSDCGSPVREIDAIQARALQRPESIWQGPARRTEHLWRRGVWT